MRHKMRGRKFGRTGSGRKFLLKNLVASLIDHEQIQTTLPKAKDIRPLVERLVTLSKENTLHVRRRLISWLPQGCNLDQKLIDSLGPRYLKRPGGYTRIVKNGFRKGDGAPLAVISFVEEKDISLAKNPSKQSAPKKIPAKKITPKGGAPHQKAPTKATP